jgi:hypothetical protein
MIFVKYKNGKTLEGIVLAMGSQSMRIAIKGSDDAAEYRRVSDRWVSDDCEVVTFELAEEEFSTENPSEVPAILASEVQPAVLHRIM